MKRHALLVLGAMLSSPIVATSIDVANAQQRSLSPAAQALVAMLKSATRR